MQSLNLIFFISGYDYGGLRREWLELLCVQFFQNTPHGMFASIGTSRLVHPTVASVRYPLWTLKHYELAGKIVGKCLFESSCGDVYTQMVKAKFSRSFLAQVLGIPPNYQVISNNFHKNKNANWPILTFLLLFQHFEQDDPELFLSKVKYILENDVAELELTFSEEEYDTNGRLKKTVELIPGGAKKKVTSENKEQYLNALALYRLSSKVTKEIDAFKRGTQCLNAYQCQLTYQYLTPNFSQASPKSYLTSYSVPLMKTSLNSSSAAGVNLT